MADIAVDEWMDAGIRLALSEHAPRITDNASKGSLRTTVTDQDLCSFRNA